MNINDRISKIIEYSGFTSSEFADEIDVQRSNISHITSGRNKPSLEFVTKIKNRFPEINWDWIINGTGEMSGEQNFTSYNFEKKEPEENNTLPDLFTLIDDENFGKTESEDKVQNFSQRESSISLQSLGNKKISDSQQLAIKESRAITKTIDNQDVNISNENSKIKKIVFFYENGKFEIFEP